MNDDRLLNEALQTIHELRVNNREVTALIGVASAQAELSAKVDSMGRLLTDIRNEQQEMRVEQKSYVKDMEMRVRALEDWRTEQKGIIKVVAAVASLVGALAAFLLQYFFGGKS